jgi:hypothetical protein
VKSVLIDDGQTIIGTAACRPAAVASGLVEQDLAEW